MRTVRGSKPAESDEGASGDTEEEEPQEEEEEEEEEEAVGVGGVGLGGGGGVYELAADVEVGMHDLARAARVVGRSQQVLSEVAHAQMVAQFEAFQKGGR